MYTKLHWKGIEIQVAEPTLLLEFFLLNCDSENLNWRSLESLRVREDLGGLLGPLMCSCDGTCKPLSSQGLVQLTGASC